MQSFQSSEYFFSFTTYDGIFECIHKHYVGITLYLLAYNLLASSGA